MSAAALAFGIIVVACAVLLVFGLCCTAKMGDVHREIDR